MVSGSLLCSIILVRYVEGSLFKQFQPFIENEIQVIIFHGHARVYLRVLYEASQFDFVNNRYKILYSYAIIGSNTWELEHACVVPVWSPETGQGGFIIHIGCSDPMYFQALKLLKDM